MLRRHSNRSSARKIFSGYEALESRHLLSGSPWQNPAVSNDVNDDDAVSPADALVAINALNSGLGGALSGKFAAPGLADSAADFLDVNGDGHLSPADALSVINSLNSGRGSGDNADDADDIPALDQQPDQIGGDVPELALPGGFARVRAELNTAGDVDVFRVTPTTTQLTATVFSKTHGDVNVSLVAANGDVIGTATATHESRHHAATVSAAVTVGNSYFIVVSGGTDVTGQYRLQAIDGSLAAPRSDDGPLHDATDDHGVDTGHDAGDDHGVDTTDDANDDHGVDATGNVNDDHGLDTGHDTTDHGVNAGDDAGDDHGVNPAGHDPGDDHDPVQAADAIFARLDANASGSLSPAEFMDFSKGAGRGNVDRLFATWDTDANSLLTLNEFTTGLQTSARR